MRIAMTGSTGLVGSRLVELLASQHEIIELREEDGFDVTALDCVRRFLMGAGAEIVVHLAAFTDVSAAWRQRGQKDGSCYRVNALGAANVARVCGELDAYLVHFSTDFVFSGEKTRGPYKETDIPGPIEWYGETKFWAEADVISLAERYAILRIAFPFRARFPQKLDIVRWILKGLEEESLPPMVVDQVITPTFIDDLAPVVSYFAIHQPSGVFHAVGSTLTTPYSLARQVALAWGFPPSVVKHCCLDDIIKKDARPRQRYLDVSNAKLQKMGLAMSDLDTALAEMRRQME